MVTIPLIFRQVKPVEQLDGDDDDGAATRAFFPNRGHLRLKEFLRQEFNTHSVLDHE